MSRRSEQLFVRKQSGYSETVASTVTHSGTTNFTGALQINGTAITATAAEINQAADVSGAYEAVTTTNVIDAAENGKTFFLNSATGFVSTLPAPALGLNFRFIVGGTPPTSGNHTVVTASSANVIHGLVLFAPTDDAGAVDDNADTISFVASQAQEGDWVEVVSDGTDWFVKGQAQVAEGITLTTAS